MSRPVVVDASVALKIVLDEEFSSSARALYRVERRAERPLVGPPLLHGEVMNAIFQKLRRREITEDVADGAVERFSSLDLAVATIHDLHVRAFDFARAHGLPNIYDSQYVVLARLLGTEFWTDDRRLLGSLGVTAPWVRWIGDYPLSGTTAS